MTILIVLVGLALSHVFHGVGRWRSFDWLLWPTRALRRRFPGNPALALATVIVTAVVVSLLATLIATALLGVLGWALLALATVVYTFGPRDLDRDVRQLIEDPGHADGVEAARALGLPGQADAPTAASVVVQAARTRWFAILLWFTVLGIPGAVLYRLCQKIIDSGELDAAELDWLARLRWVMEWPVLVLMVLSMGLVSDLDRVVAAWKRYHRDRPWWLCAPRLIDDIVAELLAGESGREAGLRRGHQFAWRVLVLWLVAMSLMLLAGWLV